jgi:hypothetical protein
MGRNDEWRPPPTSCETTKEHIYPITDQDFIHVVKRLIANADSAVRSLTFAPSYVATLLNDVELVRVSHPSEQHHLQERDTLRKDRQNWPAAQRVIKRCVRTCMANSALDEAWDGTAAYLRMCWRYTHIYYSRTISFERRVYLAAYVIHFLRLWRLSLFASDMA